MFLETDIIKRKDRVGGMVIWLAERLLLQVFESLSSAYLEIARIRYNEGVSAAKKGRDILPDTKKAWRYARMNGQFYYALANIPDKSPTNYRSKIDIDALLAAVKATKRAKPDAQKDLENWLKEALKTRKSAFYKSYAGLKNDQIERLTSGCALAEGLLLWADERGERINQVAFLQRAAAVLSQIGSGGLPINWKRLGEKLKECVENGITATIQLPRAGNANASKFQDEEIAAWLMQMRGMGQNFGGRHIARKIRLMCELTGKPVPSAAWFEKEMAKPSVKFLTAAGRYGARGRKGGLYRGYVPVEKALFAGDCWQMDGTRANFIGWATADGKTESLYQIVVRDVHSGDILAVHFCLNEDRWAYVDALKKAIRTAKYLPYELVLDRFPGHNTGEWQTVQKRIERLGTKVLYEHKATGKAQVERWFSTLQDVFFQDSKWYYGQGIQAHRDASHRSAEYLRAQAKERKNENWGFDAAASEAMACIENYRRTPLAAYSKKYATIQKSPSQLHLESEKPHVSTIQTEEFMQLFGLQKEVALPGGGLIRTTIRGVEYCYQVEDYEVLKNHRKVLLAYDFDAPEQLNSVWLFAADGSDDPAFLCEAREIRAVQMFGPNKDLGGLAKRKKAIADIDEKRRAEVLQITSKGSEVAGLLAGMAPKSEIEAVETDWQNEQIAEMRRDGKPKLIRSERPIDDQDDEPPTDIFKTIDAREIARAFY